MTLNEEHCYINEKEELEENDATDERDGEEECNYHSWDVKTV